MKTQKLNHWYLDLFKHNYHPEKHGNYNITSFKISVYSY